MPENITETARDRIPLWVVVGAISVLAYLFASFGLQSALVWAFWFAAAFMGIVVLERVVKWAMGSSEVR